jgi:hypothetical protein
MLTLEQAINRLENIVSGAYRKKFEKSALRTNTRATTEQVRFDLMTILRIPQQEPKMEALDNIINLVLDNTQMPETWQNGSKKTYADYCKTLGMDHVIMQYPDVAEECVECCNVIINRLDENTDADTTAIYELNSKYRHKYLYFRDDNIGSQYVWVKNIHKNKDNHFEIDGTVIFTNGITNTIGLYDVENHPIEDFYCFGDKENRFTKCVDVDDELQRPMDTRLKNHVITGKDVVEDVLFTFTWFYEIHLPDLAKIIRTLSLPK